VLTAYACSVTGGEVAVLIGGEEFRVTPETPLIFGRADGDSVVGLDPKDMGVSSEAGSVEFELGLWWIVNRSRKRPLLIEPAPGSATIRLEPGERAPLTRAESVVLVPGAIYTHRLDIHLPPEAVDALRVDSRTTTGTITLGQVNLSERDRDVLAALFSGYLRPFPYRDARPLSYQEAADLLGADWTKVTVRKQVERLKERMTRSGLYFQGPRANDDLAEHLMSSGLLTAADLARLDAMP
jgi:hypothetical protein